MGNEQDELETGVKAFENGEYSRAFSILMPLATQGLARAQCYVAAMYHDGLGTAVSGPMRKRPFDGIQKRPSKTKPRTIFQR